MSEPLPDPDFDTGGSHPVALFEDLLRARLSRRGLLQAVTAAGAGLAIPAQAGSAMASARPQPLHTLGFDPVAKSLADRVTVPEGYTARVLYALGDPLDGATPDFRNDGTDTSWERRAGDHHDGMEWFGLSASGQPSRHASDRGLLALNHEATTADRLASFFVHADGGKPTLPRPAAEVDKEIALHGLSVVEVRVQGGQWRYQQASRLNRRVTADTEVQIHGPVRGSGHVLTRYSPDGTRSRGTLANCGTGKTPWNTLVSGEENWSSYFHRRADDDQVRGRGSMAVAALQRYGRPAGAPSRHGWESAGSDDRHARWNISQGAASPRDDYRHEINTFGYVVEVDPYEPDAPVRKRTALGRFAHESVSFAKPVAGQPIVAYMGDDARGEYIYKFVSAARWDPRDASPARRLDAGDKYLDQGTLHVARFNGDGTGQWIELSPRHRLLAAHPRFEFRTEADVCVHTRLAADAVGATPMDRPEWSGVNPANGEVYFTLTNNSRRSLADVDAANPRAYVDRRDGKPQHGNVHGHIVRLAEARPADTDFRWDVFLFGAEAGADRSRINISRLTEDNDLSSPDGLVFSQATGICWIQTDDSAYSDQSNCMMLAAVPGRVGDGGRHTLHHPGPDGEVARSIDTHVGKPLGEGQLKRFLVGPVGSEITGCCETPDGRTLFVNIQHPGETTRMADLGKPERYTSQWPCNAGYGAGRRPRSATVVITKDDGGLIGS